MSDQWQARIYVLESDAMEAPVEAFGPTQDVVRENIKIYLDHFLPCQVRQDGQEGYTEISESAAVDRFVQEQLTIEPSPQE